MVGTGGWAEVIEDIGDTVSGGEMGDIGGMGPKLAAAQRRERTTQTGDRFAEGSLVASCRGTPRMLEAETEAEAELGGGAGRRRMERLSVGDLMRDRRCRGWIDGGAVGALV